jgi:rhodanese-related sulfurtransferase
MRLTRNTVVEPNGSLLMSFAQSVEYNPVVHVPLLSPELFDYLRQHQVAPYTKLGGMAREQLSDGVRMVSMREGETFSTNAPGLRITVLSGSVRLSPGTRDLDLETTVSRMVLTKPLANTLQAHSDSIVLLADSDFLDTLASWQELTDNAKRSGSGELAARFAKVRHSLAFRRLPLELTEQALSRMTSRTVKAGEILFNMGDPGDAFYLIWSGRVGIWRPGLYDDAVQLVAELISGDTFGEESLLTGGTRNATVKAIEDTELLVLGHEDFKAIMSQPLVEELPAEAAAKMVDAGWKIVDVRYAEEFEDAHIPGAILLPLPDLRDEAEGALSKSDKYVTVCRSGKRSVVGAFLLKQRGYSAISMKGGMGAWSGATESSY